jgi:hypothetical protein
MSKIEYFFFKYFFLTFKIAVLSKKCLMVHHLYTAYFFPKNKLFSVMSNCSTVV